MTTIHYQLTEQEVVRGFIKHRKPLKRIFWARLVLCVCGLLLLIENYVLSAHPDNLLLVFSLVFIGLPVVLWIISPSRIYRAYAKVVRGNAVFTDPKEVTFDPKGITFVSPNRRTELTWAAFVDVTGDERYFYLHSDHLGHVTLLPRRAFGTGDAELFQLCASRTPES